jgi:hypothetical protein
MSLQSSFIPSLSVTPNKIMVGVPTKDSMYSHFAYCLQAMVQYNTQRGINTEVEFNMGTLIGNQRERIAEKAISIGATHILWLDSDMMFPKSICETLLSHNLDFVACNYSTRVLPFKAVGYTEIYNWNSGIAADAAGLVLVEGIGLGCALTRVEIFDDIDKPWFPITYVEETNDYLGEDMNFCLKVRETGRYIAVDCDTSKEIYHIGTAAYRWNKTPGDNTQEVK